ncbi:MAG: STAS domain-containing protein [Solirubrobacteraceae bacterium]
MASPVKIASDLWAAYETGGVDAVLDRVADDVVWQPDPHTGAVLRGADELRSFAAGADCALELVEIEDHGQAVLMAVRAGGREILWVLHFRLGRLWRLASFAEREDAVGSLVALQAIAGPLFGARERDGVVRVRGELDVATASSLEKLLLRERERGEVVELDLSELGFMDSTGLRVLLRARQAAERGGWEVVLTAASPPVQRLFTLSGVRAALPRQAY